MRLLVVFDRTQARRTRPGNGSQVMLSRRCTPASGSLYGLALYSKYTDWQGTEWCFRALGQLALEQGDMSAARRFFRQDLGFAQASGEAYELAVGLEGLAGALVERQPDRAVRLAAAAAALRDSMGARPYALERERLDHWLEAAIAKLSQDAYAAAWAEGRIMPQEQVFALVGPEDRDDPSPQPARGAEQRSRDELSPRERQVVRLVAAGRTNRQIAERLVIAPRTADTHVGNILTRLGLHTRAELAVWAVERGLIPLDGTNTAVSQ
jgi:DNA-binding CsgD family transcriptional regulator